MYSGISFTNLFDLLVEFSFLAGKFGGDFDLYHHHLAALVVAVQPIKTLTRQPDLVSALRARRDL